MIGSVIDIARSNLVILCSPFAQVCRYMAALLFCHVLRSLHVLFCPIYFCSSWCLLNISLPLGSKLVRSVRFLLIPSHLEVHS